MSNGNGKDRTRPTPTPAVGIEDYKGYQIVDKGDCYHVLHGTDYVGGANLVEEAKSLADADIEKRKAVNFKNMGRHEPKETDLI